jgi:hypothetical protein
MAVTIVTTVGGASSNSYATLAEAETYMEGRLNGSTWDADTDDNKNRALVEAARELQVLRWTGTRVDTTQALAWPRQWAVDVDDPNGDYYATTEVPQRVKDAQMELAFQFIKAGTTDLAALDSTDGIIRKKIDVLETEYARPTERVTGLQRYPRVWDRVAALLDSVGSGVNIDLVRG